MLTLVPVTPAHLPAIKALEAAGYPADEAASPEALDSRLAAAPAFFKAAVEGGSGVVVGFVCGTAAVGDTLTHESMEGHASEGTTLCIHSVVVDGERRRQGVATWMVKRFLATVFVESPHIDRVRLIAKDGLRALYRGAGFTDRGLSAVVHGADPWYELGIDVDARARGLPMAQVDAFTSSPFGGNPAAFVFLPVLLADAADFSGDAAVMQSLALENNLSETAFVRPTPSGVYQLRWFTPNKEVDLCGHATVAAAHAMFSLGIVPRTQETIAFVSRSGPLSAARVEGQVELNFPAEPPAPASDAAAIAPAVHAGFNLRPEDVLGVHRNRMDVLVHVTKLAFDALKMVSVAQVNSIDCRGVIVTAEGGPDEPWDITSRFFAPRFAVDEDPVTGSAHCALYPFWASILGERPLVARQASARGGDLHLSAGEADRVKIRGSAVTAFVADLSEPITTALLRTTA